MQCMKECWSIKKQYQKNWLLNKIYQNMQVIFEDGRYFCVCVCVASTSHIHIYTRALCMHLSNWTTNTHALTHKHAHTRHARMHAQNHICHDQWPQGVDCPLKATQTNTARAGDRERAKARIERVCVKGREGRGGTEGEKCSKKDGERENRESDSRWHLPVNTSI